MHWLIITFITLILIYSLLTYFEDKIESFQVKVEPPVINFPIAQKFSDAIQQSEFFDRMSKLDLIARQSLSISVYRQKYIDGIQQFTDKQKKTITDVINSLTSLTARYPRLHKIPWNLVKIDKSLEHAYPHSMNTDLIVLNDDCFSVDKNLAEILLHEKIHLYQRDYPDFTRIYVEQDKKYVPLAMLQCHQDLIRNNPDENGVVYADALGKIAITEYASRYPVDVSDVRYVLFESNNNASIQSCDMAKDTITEDQHPYEVMARELTKAILGNYQPTYWMVRYL